MRAKYIPHLYAADSMAVSRPVRRPSDSEARWGLAKDLSRGNFDKVMRLINLPLMEVALLGLDGMEEADAVARRRLVA